jgi:hypothetical protein
MGRRWRMGHYRIRQYEISHSRDENFALTVAEEDAKALE